MSEETKVNEVNNEEKQPKTPKKQKPEPVEIRGVQFERGPAGNMDYVEFGSEAHAHILNMREAVEGDYITAKDSKGRTWTITDATAFPAGTSDAFLNAILHERIRILQTVPTVPANAPGLWMPNDEEGGRVYGVIS